MKRKTPGSRDYFEKLIMQEIKHKDKGEKFERGEKRGESEGPRLSSRVNVTE